MFFEPKLLIEKLRALLESKICLENCITENQVRIGMLNQEAPKNMLSAQPNCQPEQENIQNAKEQLMELKKQFDDFFEKLKATETTIPIDIAWNATDTPSENSFINS